MLPLVTVDCCLRKWKKTISTCLTVVWESGRSWFPLARKSVTLVKICSFLKNWLSLISVTVSTRRKNLWTKERVSTSQKIRFHQPEWRISLKNAFPLNGKKAGVTGRSLWKMEKKNDFHKLENHLFTSKNKLFLRLFTPNSNNGFY